MMYIHDHITNCVLMTVIADYYIKINIISCLIMSGNSIANKQAYIMLLYTWYNLSIIQTITEVYRCLFVCSYSIPISMLI